MARKFKKRKIKKPRSILVVAMILSRKGGAMKDKRKHQSHDDLIDEQINDER